FSSEIFHIDFSQNDPRTFQSSFQFIQEQNRAFIGVLLIYQVSPKVNFFTKAGIQDQILVIRRVVRHHGHWRPIETFNQKTHAVIGRQVNWSNYIVCPFTFYPLFSSLEQFIGNLLIVNTIKETELTFIYIVKLIMVCIVNCCDTPDNLIILVSQEQLHG